MALSNTSGVTSLSDMWMTSPERQNYVMDFNKSPINVDGSIREASSAEKAKIDNMMGGGKKVVRVSKASRAPYDSQSGVITPATEQAQEVVPGETADSATAAVLERQGADYANARKAIAAGNFLVDVMNAQNAYQNAGGQAALNIMMARNSASDAIYRGRQAALDRQSEGFKAGEDASLAMAAQGQDVQASATSKVRGSYEAMGYMNAAREEINAIREAMGYELEIVNYELQQDMALINRDVAVIGSALNTAVTLGTGGA